MKKVYLIAVVFALLAGFATYLFASQIDKKSTIKDADTVPVLYAVQDIPENTLITEEMIASDANYFAKKDTVKDFATPSPISDMNTIVGQVTCVDIHSGEQLNEFKFVSTEDENVGLSYKLSPGKVAFSFSANSTNGVDGYISAGDTVDIITYSASDDGKVSTKVAYSNLNVIRVSDAANQSTDSKITQYSTITVEVTRQEALRLYEIESSETFKLVLNSKRDEKTDAAIKAAQQASQAATTAAAN